jgi:hypothetical protein
MVTHTRGVYSDATDVSRPIYEINIDEVVGGSGGTKCGGAPRASQIDSALAASADALAGRNANRAPKRGIEMPAFLIYSG